MIKKIIKIFRFLIFFCTLIITMSIFALYAIFKYDDQLYVKSTHLTPDRSEHLKELIGLSEFSNLYIEKYIHKVVEGETGREATFDITIPVDEYEDFTGFIDVQTSVEEYEEQSYLIIEKDSLVLENQLYRLQIKYISPKGDGYVFLYLFSSDSIRFSKNTGLILAYFFLLLFANSLIILPYRRIIIFLHNNKKVFRK